MTNIMTEKIDINQWLKETELVDGYCSDDGFGFQNVCRCEIADVEKNDCENENPSQSSNMLNRCTKRKACNTILCFVGLALFIIFVFIPTVWRYSPTLQKSMIFLNDDNLPTGEDYSHPDVYGMNGTRNLYIVTSDNVTLGLWHTLPSSLVTKFGKNKLSFERSLSHGEPIVIYMHGNSGARANALRVELYQKLQEIDCHVIAVDYRGYGDSSDVDIDETGLVLDVIETYRWIEKRANGSPIFGWGHSLGTGIGAHAFSLLEEENIYPSGLVLEAPFYKMSEAIRDYSTAKFLRFLPWFDFFITDPVIENDIAFDTEQNLKDTKVPVLILHAEDDSIIPYQQGEQLYNFLINDRKGGKSTDLVLYEARNGFGHMFICRDKDLEKKIKKFMEHCLMTTT